MLKKVLLLIAAIFTFFIAMFSYAVYLELAHNDCGLDEKQARSKVERFLKRKELPLEYIKGPTENVGSCSYTYLYEGAGEKYDFIILSTWVHGVKLTFWDHSRGDGP